MYPLIIIGSITGVYPLKIQHKTRYVKIEGLFNERYEFIQYRGFIVEETLGLGVFNLRGACCGILVLINYAAAGPSQSTYSFFAREKARNSAFCKSFFG